MILGTACLKAVVYVVVSILVIVLRVCVLSYTLLCSLPIGPYVVHLLRLLSYCIATNCIPRRMLTLILHYYIRRLPHIRFSSVPHIAAYAVVSSPHDAAYPILSLPYITVYSFMTNQHIGVGYWFNQLEHLHHKRVLLFGNVCDSFTCQLRQIDYSGSSD